MSKKLFWGATLPGCLVLALVWAMLALSGGALADPPDGNGNHNHGGGGGGGGGTIAVTVTFRDFLGDGDFPPDRLMSDGLGDYIHKVDKVSTGIDTPGDFSLRLGLPKRNRPSPIRTLFFDFRDCMEGPCNPPFEGGFSGMAMFTSGVNLSAMAVGEVRDDLSMIVTFKPSEEDSSWRLFFDPLDDRCEGSTNITVTRIDAHTWEIEAGPTDIACLAEQPGGGLIFSGLYRLPFKMTVRAIQD